MMTQRPTAQSGYVLLMSVLVTGAVATATATSILLLGLGSARSGFVAGQGDQAARFADSCIEDALHQLRIDDTFVAGQSLSFANGSCTVVAIFGSGQLNRTIQAEGSGGDVVWRTEVQIDSLDPVTVSRWEAVDHF